MSESPIDRFRRADAIFEAALDLSADEQTALVDRACGDDADLRAEVLSLLRAYHQSDSFLSSPAVNMAAPILASAPPAVGSLPARLGPFRVVREIGRGGMGTVYLGERADDQFEQRVALKLIQHAAPGMVRRFAAERRILALLEHPGIARLIDGGITAEGLPYFAMEFVEGEPIDRFCTAREITLERRLGLFVRVCEAISYAHQHLVIHQDLKPSNILVTAGGQVKLLDFGIATVLGARQDSAGTTRTEFMALTPEVAAPEQVLGVSVSTATDVYSLGVLLYRLLTDVRPYDLRGRPPSEIERIVCEDDPPKPSSRVPAPLRSRLRGDLDTIVMKALRKDPAQRYASVQDMAEDIRRYLSGYPVHARGLTAAYRTQRFIQRHAWSLAAISAIVLLITAYAISMTVQQARIAGALADARTGALRAEQVTDFMLGLFEASDYGQAFADTLVARDLLDRGIARARELTGQPEVRAQMLDAVGQIHMQLGEFRLARAVFEEALAARREVLHEEHADVATSLVHVAGAASRAGDYDVALQLHVRGLAIRRRALGDRHPATLDAIYRLAHSLHESGNARDAQPLFDEWMAAVAAAPPEVTPNRATQLVNLGVLLMYGGDPDQAQRFLARAVEIRQQIFGERHVSVADALTMLAGAYVAAGRPEDAERAERQAVTMLRALHPDGHPDLADAVRGLAVALHRLQRWDEAEQLYLEQQEMARRFFGDDHVTVGNGSEDLGLLMHGRRRYDRAEPYLRNAVRIYRLQYGAESLLTRRAEVVLGDVLWRRGDVASAEPLLLAGYAALSDRRVRGFDYALPIAIESLADLYESQNRTAEAARYRALLMKDSSSN